MKIALLLLLTLTGCTTVYRVDGNGVCRAPDGKTVNIASVNPDAFFTKLANFGVSEKYKSGRHFTSLTADRDMVQYCRYTGGTCYGW
jgi:hypothetical protein